MTWLDGIGQIEEFEDASFDAALVAEMEYEAAANGVAHGPFLHAHFQGI